MEYTILFSREFAHLIEKVNEFLEKGWRPQGGVAVMVFLSGDTGYLQAMIRDK